MNRIKILNQTLFKFASDDDEDWNKPFFEKMENNDRFKIFPDKPVGSHKYFKYIDPYSENLPVRKRRWKLDGKVMESGNEKYDLDVTDIEEIEDEFGWKIKTKPKEGLFEEIPQNNSYMYRGMTWEGWQGAQKQGFVQSKGAYNLGDEQKGLTYWSHTASQAAYYAKGFPPVHLYPTKAKPSYVVATDKKEGVYVPGTGEDEIGIPFAIPLSEIKEVWETVPYCFSEGCYSFYEGWRGKQDGSRMGLSSAFYWRRIL